MPSDSDQSLKREWVAEVATVVKSSHTTHSRDLPPSNKVTVPKDGRLIGLMTGQIPEYWIVSEGVVDNKKLPDHIRFIHKRQWRLLPLPGASELVTPPAEGITDARPPKLVPSISESGLERTTNPISIPKGPVKLEVGAERSTVSSLSLPASTEKSSPVGLFASFRRRLLGW
jgi:hypothetical protein